MALTLTPKTTIGTLLDEYPFLLDFLAGYHPEFNKLTNPVARRTVGRFATLERAAGMAGVPVDKLQGDMAAEIARQTGATPQSSGSTATGVDATRQEELKSIIGELHAGKTPEEVKARFEALIKDVEATEIAAMEQALMAEGLPDTEVKRLCDVHMQVFQEALEANPSLCVPAGHPLDTFQRENREALEITGTMHLAAAEAGGAATAAGAVDWPGRTVLTTATDRLAEYERHYVRKENQLFPFLERHNVEGPTKVMWALHDDIRAVLKELRTALAVNDRAAAVHAADEAATMVDDMVNKEEKVLFPMALDVLSDQEWRDIRAGEAEIGYALITDVPDWPAAGEAAPAAPAAPAPGGPTAGAAPRPGGPGPLPLSTGTLTPEQIDLVFRRLPVDLTFVDENDEVRFYSEGERVFPRSPGVIGRKVQNCHPSASVHKVQEIVDAFRAGEKNTAEFWIQMGEKFVHIRYFALRDANGGYRGVLETTQDVTGIRALEGQRRLVDW
jgi:uncharacterized protein